MIHLVTVATSDLEAVPASVSVRVESCFSNYNIVILYYIKVHV